MTYEYVLQFDDDKQRQVQCIASSFEAAWDIARNEAMRYGAKLIELWGV